MITDRDWLKLKQRTIYFCMTLNIIFLYRSGGKLSRISPGTVFALCACQGILFITHLKCIVLSCFDYKHCCLPHLKNHITLEYKCRGKGKYQTLFSWHLPAVWASSLVSIIVFSKMLFKLSSNTSLHQYLPITIIATVFYLFLWSLIS